MSIKINFETPLEFFAQSGIWRTNQNVRFAFLVHLYNSEVSDADLVSKTNPVVTKKLYFENLENQSELHLLDIPHCRNFDARMKKLIFHTWLAPQTRKFQLKFCSGNINLQCVFMNTFAFKYRVKTFLKHFLVFSDDQYVVGSIKIFHFSLLFSYKTRWFPLKTLLEKNKLVVTEKFDSQKQGESIWLQFLDLSHCQNFNSGIPNYNFQFHPTL